DGMGKFVVENLVKKLIYADIPFKRARLAIFGFTFNEDCPDTRNTRVIDMVKELSEYGIEPYIIDPVADKEEAKLEYGLEFDDLSKMVNL
ncbi:nucleotide sugar dehydrogenase, partial [Francisella tularensis subsp. holarctica]|uniref:UDP binding domain-containing protein n=1 Tax=Francisella tularensis TaxID=263 RepID=UPI0023819C56